MEFVTRNSIKKILKVNKMRVSTLVYGKLDKKLEVILKEACERAKMNGRTTVMPQDI